MVYRDCLSRLFFLRIYDFRIDLSCLDIGMPQHFTQGIDVRTIRNLNCCVTMPETMECNVLCDASSFYPSFDGTIDP